MISSHLQFPIILKGSQNDLKKAIFFLRSKQSKEPSSSKGTFSVLHLRESLDVFLNTELKGEHRSETVKKTHKQFADSSLEQLTHDVDLLKTFYEQFKTILAHYCMNTDELTPLPEGYPCEVGWNIDSQLFSLSLVFYKDDILHTGKPFHQQQYSTFIYTVSQ